MVVKDSLLMIVCKYPSPGHVKTRLAETIGFEPATDVCRAMLFDLLENHRGKSYEVIIETNDNESIASFQKLVPEIHIHAATGDDLRGPRSLLWDAFKYHCATYRRVIAVYADTPFITSRIVTNAFERLNQYDVVLGPCIGFGCYYLVGMKKPVDLFTSHKKGRFPFYKETVTLIDDMSLSYYALEPRSDVDTVEDIGLIDWDTLDGDWRRTRTILSELGLLKL